METKDAIKRQNRDNDGNRIFKVSLRMFSNRDVLFLSVYRTSYFSLRPGTFGRHYRLHLRAKCSRGTQHDTE